MLSKNHDILLGGRSRDKEFILPRRDILDMTEFEL